MAQSGGFTNILVRKLSELGMRVSKAVSYGNACDLNEIDFLSYFQHDEKTKIITAYIEGVQNGRRFIKAAKEAALTKPVVIWKAGLTSQGSRAVSSHTASLGGQKRVWNGFFRQTGVIPATDGVEMLDLIIGLKCIPNFTGKRMSVVGGGGAITVAASDALSRAGLSILPFSSKIRKAIQAHLPLHGNSVNNPVDVGSPLFEPEMLRPILEIVAGVEFVDAVIVEHMIITFSGAFNEELAQVIQSVRESTGKPFIVTLPQNSFGSDTIETENTRRKYREWYLSRRIPVFDSVAHAANVLGKIARYNAYLTKNPTGGYRHE
jgi:acyl-CoA synthetase (NDP forming)